MDNLTLEEAIAILSIDSVNEEVDDFVISCAKAKAQLEEVIEAEDAGEMDDEETDQAIAAILIEHSEETIEIFDLEIEPAEYSESNNYVASFREGLSSVLAGLIAEEYENPEDGIADIAEATGADIKTIEEIISGDAVPDLVMGQQIAEVFDSLQDDNAYKEWNGLVSQAYGEVAQEVSTSTPVEVMENPETQEALATMSAQQNNLIAEFNQMKSQAQLAEELRILDQQASDLVDQGIITPYEKTELLGNFSDVEDGIALFSQACQLANTPPAVQLDRIKYYLHTKQRTGQPSALFSEFSDGTPLDASALTDSDQAFVSEYLNEII